MVLVAASELLRRNCAVDGHGIDARSINGLIGLSGPYDFLPIESGYLLEVFPEKRRAASRPVNFVSTNGRPVRGRR